MPAREVGASLKMAAHLDHMHLIDNASGTGAVSAVPDLAGKVAWVTGAGSGIGEAAALALAREGAAVALTGRRREPLQAVADQIIKAGGKALVAPGDLGEQEAAGRIAAAIAKEFGRLDILVNNAGANMLERSWAKLTSRAHQVRCSMPISTARSIVRSRRSRSCGRRRMAC